MAVVEEMKTFNARLATFDIVHPAPKRTSGAKGTKGIAWPHSRPSPAELAYAGFYYNPSSVSPDNASCYLCGRGLDGWEEEDNPVEEHLTHSSECGWAIMASASQHSSNPAEIEDPTGKRMTEARRSTFMSSWPHESKRGWVCKTEKLVEAGWYFCPTEESEDFVSCAYCKLSLDGWEPKDDPYDEHYRRSSDCSFFAFSTVPGKKGTRQSRAKKSRASKTSRVSTQSNATTVSDAGTIDVDDALEQSTISQATTKSKTTKKSTKGKAKGGKTKKEEPVEPDTQMEVESNNGGSDEKPRTKRAGRGKKRTSDEMDDGQQEKDASVEPERPAKKKTARSRNTATQESVDSDVEMESLVVTIPEDPAPKQPPSKSRGGKKKQSSSSTRKPSAESTASKASLRSRVPDDAEIEAELEAGLEDDISEDEIDAIPQGVQSSSQGLNRSEPLDTGYQGSSASVAPVRAPKRSKNEGHVNETIERHQSISEDEFEDTPPKAGRKVPAKRKVTTKKSARAEGDVPSQALESSMVSVEVRVDDSGNEADAGTSSKPAKKATKKKGTGRKAKKTTTEPSAKQTKAPPLREASEDSDLEYDESVQKQTGEGRAITNYEAENEHDDDEDVVDRVSMRQPSVSQDSEKLEDRDSDAPLPRPTHPNKNQHRVQDPEPSVINISSPAPIQKHTPSPSPQSSDAENRPPSTRPSANRPPVLSPSKKVNIMVPLAASTPSASPSKRNMGTLNTTYPWSATDVEEILLSGSLDKENIDLSGALNEAKGGLNSPQKKMTVEEWILWNSKNGEEKLRQECERLVGIFEKEGGRAMMALEGIECIE
ncbi:hypothetical protein FQN54_000115 [Arachnomyces sp. PD_36]|nr:hypothetical protein FQN54_000115 [Arachnomyces sp. PD_36]